MEGKIIIPAKDWSGEYLYDDRSERYFPDPWNALEYYQDYQDEEVSEGDFPVYLNDCRRIYGKTYSASLVAKCLLEDHWEESGRKKGFWHNWTTA